MKRLVNIIIIVVLTGNIFASLQSSGCVIIGNDTLYTYSDLFEKYERHDSLIYDIDKQVLQFRKKDKPEKYLTEEIEVMPFYSTWEVLDDKMYLTKIEQYSNKLYDIDLKELFNDKESKGKVFVSWLTDTIYISKGKVLVEGIKPIRIFETELIVKDGILIQRRNYENYISKESNFIVNEEFIYRNINWEKLPDFSKKSIQTYIGIKPRKNGKLDGIDEGSFVIIDSKIITDKDNPFLKEAYRIAKLVPEWNVVVQRNEIVTLSMTIYFDERTKQKYAR